MRRAYRRAVSVPPNSIDALYREYDAFEHGVSPTLAKALLAEVKPKVDHIRVVLKERKKKTDPLVVGGLSGRGRLRWCGGGETVCSWSTRYTSGVNAVQTCWWWW